MRSGKHGFARGVAGTLAAFALLVAGALLTLGRVNTASTQAQADMVRDAIHSALITCYAVEGDYPIDLGYLKAHYGLAYDEERFLVYYDAFASNILPEVRVNVRGANGD